MQPNQTQPNVNVTEANTDAQIKKAQAAPMYQGNLSEKIEMDGLRAMSFMSVISSLVSTVSRLIKGR
jgi:hypothetical protein